MKNKKVIIIATTSIIVIGIIFLAFKNINKEKIDLKNIQLQKDFDLVLNNIDKAKK